MAAARCAGQHPAASDRSATPATRPTKSGAFIAAMPLSKLCVSRIAPAASAVPITICECKGRYEQRQYHGDLGDDQRPADPLAADAAGHAAGRLLQGIGVGSRRAKRREEAKGSCRSGCEHGREDDQPTIDIDGVPARNEGRDARRAARHHHPQPEMSDGQSSGDGEEGEGDVFDPQTAQNLPAAGSTIGIPL